MQPSLSSRIIAGMLKLLRFNKIVEKQVGRKKPVSPKSFVPKSIRRSYLVTTRRVHAREVATFEHREQVTRNHLIFFHGGAYVFEASPFHWTLAKKILEKSFCRITLVDYPLAPEHGYQETLGMAEAAFDLLSREYPGDRFFFLGDSAGGGLALALSQKLTLERPVAVPAGNILLSPWLDLTMSNPDIKDLEQLDPILTVAMLRRAASFYAKGDDQAHYWMSPINGAFENLPPTLVFYGTRELFHADCRRLRSMVSSLGPRFQFREYEGMLHDWSIFPIPESRQVIEEICTFLKE